MSKGVAPVVTAGNILYMPFIGPGPASAGLEVIAPSGGPHITPPVCALGAGSVLAVAGSDGRLRVYR